MSESSQEMKKLHIINRLDMLAKELIKLKSKVRIKTPEAFEFFNSKLDKIEEIIGRD